MTASPSQFGARMTSCSIVGYGRPNACRGRCGPCVVRARAARAPRAYHDMKIALLQVNPTVGDLAGNAAVILDALHQAAALGAELAVTPELSLAGYLPRDLLLSSGFVQKAWRTLEALACDAASLPPVLVGLPEPTASDEGRPLYNCAA